jgi:hypothetical protein
MAENVGPEILVNKVLGKMQDVLLNGDGNVVPRSDDHFVSMLSPGIPMSSADFDYALEGFGGVYRRNVDPADVVASTGPQEQEPDVEQQLAADARRKYMNAESFSRIVHLIPDASRITETSQLNTWNPEADMARVYAMALQQSQVYDNEPDETTRKKLESWRSKLVTTRKEKDIVTDEEVEVTEESPLVTRYHEKMADYLAAELEYQSARISAMSGKDEQAVHRMAVGGALLQLKVTTALRQWAGIGRKGDYERLVAAIRSVEDRAFVLLKEHYRDEFARSIITNPSTGMNFVYAAPASPSFAKSTSGWSQFYFDSSSFRDDYSFSGSSTQAAGAFHVGSFGIAGGGSVTHNDYRGTFDASKFHLKFKMARVPISRPGIALDYLLSPFWRFDANDVVLRDAVISNGGRPPKGLMPAITTDCVFIKDLELDFGDTHSDFVSNYRSIGGSAGLTWGPFHLGGRHAQTNSSGTTNATWTNQGVKVDGMQLCATLGYLLPKTPNPDPDITNWI